ncbi:glycosyltransferase [Aeromonas sobria]|uniref:glycosyltransferase n=1 Tax=Aeromonas sobria TaxID=646 RepID=UPI000C6CBF12|nr:glycosyltransferase [Aeromonas sobria]PKQ74615.1 hypothetical protein CJF47_13520 [Aeromonas sobria]
MNSLTIITINYNNFSGLEKTLKNIRDFKGDHKSIEYVIIDGGSTDNSIDLIHQNIDIVDLFVSEKDGGIYDAMNKGIDKANGDFVIFMNSGDTFHYDFKFKDYIDALEGCHANFSDVIIYGDVLHSVDDCFFRYLAVDDSNHKWWLSNTPCHQSLFLPSSFLKKNKFSLQYKIYADADQMLKAFNELPVKIKINKAVSIFEIGGACSSAKDGWKKFLRKNLERKKIYNDKTSFIRFSVVTLIRYTLLRFFGEKKYYLLSAAISSYRTS